MLLLTRVRAIHEYLSDNIPIDKACEHTKKYGKQYMQLSKRKWMVILQNRPIRALGYVTAAH